MISLKVDHHTDNEWNQNLLNSPLGTIFQTKEYALYVKSRLGSKPFFLKFYHADGELLAQLLVFFSPKISGKITKIFGRGKTYSFFLKISALLPHYFHWQFGPVIFNESYTNDILATLGNFLISKKYHFNGSFHPLKPNLNFPSNFNFKQNLSGTFIIDLTKSFEQIIKNFDKKSTIKNIQRSENRGVVITEIKSEDDLFLYYKLQKESRLRNNLVPYSYEDIKKGMEFLKPLGSTGFLSWLGDTPTGAIMITSFNGYIIQSGSARSEIDSLKKLHSQDLLKWHVIQWGIKNKCRYYDFGGIKLTNRTPKEDGIYMHKKKWGGKLISYPTYTF